MPGFLYYIPNLLGPPADLIAAGVGHAFESKPVCRQITGNGPNGHGGVLLGDGQRVPEVGYFPTRQRWIKDPTRELWVGVHTDGPLPGPADLLRQKPITGHWLELLDGQQWLVPIARQYQEEDGELRWAHNLPRRLARAQDGTWQSTAIVPRYQAIWDLAQRWENSSIEAARNAGKKDDEDVATFKFNDVVESAIRMLAVNYLVGSAEIDLLGLLSTELASEILDALCDVPTRLAWFRKKKQAAGESDGSNTGDGPGDSTPATDPP